MFCPKCGKPMLDRDNDFYCMKDYVLIDKKTGKQVTAEDQITGLKRLDENLRRKLIKYFPALYVDGYAYLETNEAFIYVFEDFLRVSIGTSEPTFDFNLKYDTIEALQVLEEREITALRTYLIGPTLAALFKKRTLILDIGFSDSLGLQQNPSLRWQRTILMNATR
jgi:hypothetical protein